MTIDNDGWIKLWRKTLNSRIFKNEGILKIWIWCLLKASSHERWVSMKVGRSVTEIKVKPGQFVFGRDSAAKELGMSPSTIWKRINKLKNMGNCDIESNSKYSIITIVNWDTYQALIQKSDSKSNSQVTAREHKQDSKEGKDLKDLKPKEQDFILPSGEEINESSLIKIDDDLDKICTQLRDRKIFNESFKFKGQMVKAKKNKRAILHALSRCYLSKPKSPYPYCLQIMKVEDGNFNERNHSRTKK